MCINAIDVVAVAVAVAGDVAAPKLMCSTNDIVTQKTSPLASSKPVCQAAVTRVQSTFF